MKHLVFQNTNELKHPLPPLTLERARSQCVKAAGDDFQGVGSRAETEGAELYVHHGCCGSVPLSSVDRFPFPLFGLFSVEIGSGER